MYKNDNYPTKIDIQLENGIYQFDSIYSLGKTRLYNVLKEMQAAGENVISYSYTDKKNGVDLASLLEKNPNPSVIMLDRYTMFNGEYSDEIVKHSDNSIILIACTTPLFFTDKDEICFISMTGDSITVDD